MASTHYWDRFPKVSDNPNSVNTGDHTEDYWGQFAKAEDMPLEGSSTPFEPNHPQGLDQNPSFLDKAKRLGGIAAHGFAGGVGGLADLATLATKDMEGGFALEDDQNSPCLLYTSPSPRDRQKSRMPSSA